MREVDYYDARSCFYCGDIVDVVKIFDADYEETVRACFVCFG